VPTFDARETLRFGDFELDLAGYELRCQGRAVKLERRPMDLLILLVEKRRQLVSRSDIVDRLWGKDVFVDVETGVNTAISKIRQALRDSAETPSFVETIPGKGYRFIASVEIVSGPGGARSSPTRRVILAVLPFENLSGESERDCFADGLAEETIAALGQIDPEHVRVIGRTSINVYKGTTKSIAEIGGELRADYLVESSIRSESGRLRITSRLIRVSDQTQVWSESFDREPISMLGLQRGVSIAIAEQIRLTLSPERLSALARRHTHDADAYDLYLRGRGLANRATPAANARAVEYYERAIALDPTYALAWSGLAFIHAGSTVNGDAPPLVVGPRARDAAARALQADPELAEVQTAVGYVAFVLEWDWPRSERALRRAIALDPHYAAAHRTLGHLLSQMGRHEEAATAMQRARDLEPLEPLHHALSAQVAFQARDYSAAVEHARQALVVDPEFWIPHIQVAQAYMELGKTAMAFDALNNAGRFSELNSKSLSFRGYLLAKLGRADDARDVLKTLAAVSRERYVPPYQMALVHAGLGEREAVFEWLTKAHEARDVHLIFLTVEPKWDSYRGDSRFEALLARCGFTRADVTTSSPLREGRA
jgi:TolB-like protein/Flp pilus assembly protein TadD